MPSADTLIAFWACPSCWASPRARQHFVLLQSAQRGWRAGMAVVVGLCCGLVVHTGAVALGLAAVFAASAVAFTVLKLLGRPTWRTWRGGRPAGTVVVCRA